MIIAKKRRYKTMPCDEGHLHDVDACSKKSQERGADEQRSTKGTKRIKKKKAGDERKRGETKNRTTNKRKSTEREVERKEVQTTTNA